MTEFVSLQDVLYWVFWPAVELGLGLFVGTGILVSVFILFVKLGKRMTNAR